MPDGAPRTSVAASTKISRVDFRHARRKHQDLPARHGRQQGDGGGDERRRARHRQECLSQRHYITSMAIGGNCPFAHRDPHLVRAARDALGQIDIEFPPLGDRIDTERVGGRQIAAVHRDAELPGAG